MAVLWLSFGVFTLLRPDNVRAVMDNFVDAWKKGSWHPYRMRSSFLRFTGLVEIAGGPCSCTSHTLRLPADSSRRASDGMI
jgi:hypothetical protein